MKETNETDITLSDLFGDMAEVAEIIGLPATLKLIRSWGGETLYVPKQDSIVRSVRDRKIRAEFNGVNHGELAQRHGLTVNYIRTILKQQQQHEAA